MKPSMAFPRRIKADLQPRKLKRKLTCALLSLLDESIPRMSTVSQNSKLSDGKKERSYLTLWWVGIDVDDRGVDDDFDGALSFEYQLHHVISGMNGRRPFSMKTVY